MNARIVVAVGCGIVIGATLVAQFTGLLRPSRSASIPTPVVERSALEVSPRPIAPPVERVAPVVATADPYSAPPLATLRNAPAASAPTAPGRIFRCRVDGKTTYSGEPCPNGQVIDGTNAVDGFDSRPSAKLERLVANGREAAGETPPPNRVARAGVGPIREPVECATMRRQIIDLDERARYPASPRTLDDLRAVRQDIRTSMARLRC